MSSNNNNRNSSQSSPSNVQQETVVNNPASVAVADKDKDKDKDKWTTVRIREVNAEALRKLMRYPDNNVDDTLTRFLNGDVEFHFEMLAVNGEGARTTKSTVDFQIGDRPPRYYHFENYQIVEIPPPVMKIQQQASNQPTNRP